MQRDAAQSQHPAGSAVPAATIPVFYTPAQVAVTASMSPSAEKPAKVVASWQARGHPIRVVAPQPVTVDDFALAHDRAFVAAGSGTVTDIVRFVTLQTGGAFISLPTVPELGLTDRGLVDVHQHALISPLLDLE